MTPIIQSEVKEKPDFFRALKDNGIISYAEYLFLLSLMRKSETNFRIPFSFIDISQEGVISSHEFKRFISMSIKNSNFDAADPEKEIPIMQEKTTLMVHFFGPKNDHQLKFEEFSAFLSNFQREILLAEFLEYSQGQDVISNHDFLAMLIKYTKLTPEEVDDFHSRISEGGHLTFHHWEQFIKFLNALEDFSIAIKLYSMSGRSFSKDEFSRAAQICLQGQALSKQVTDILFDLFLDSGTT